MRVIICEQWELNLANPAEDDFKWSYVNYLTKNKAASQHFTNTYHLYKILLEHYQPSDIRSITEYFGGVGAESIIAHNLVNPYEHTVIEFGEHAAKHLANELPRPIEVIHADAFAPESHVPADLVSLDWDNGTVWRTREGEPHRGLLDRVFADKPRAVLMSDQAARYRHLNVERYESLLGKGTCCNYPSYIVAYAQRIEELYGYRLRAAYYRSVSSKMLFLPRNMVDKVTVQPVEASPVGMSLAPGWELL